MAESSLTAQDGEGDKSHVTSGTPAPPKPEFSVGDHVQLDVVKDGKREAKEMEVVKAELKKGSWMYQVKLCGGGPELHQDVNGNDWFGEDDLELWWDDDA